MDPVSKDSQMTPCLGLALADRECTASGLKSDRQKCWRSRLEISGDSESIALKWDQKVWIFLMLPGGIERA